MQITQALQIIKANKLVAITDNNTDVGDWLIVAQDIDYNFCLEHVQQWLATSNEQVFEIYGYAKLDNGDAYVLDGEVAYKQ